MSQLDSVPMAQDRPIARSLTVGDQAQRGHEIAPLVAGRQEARTLPNGYALRFPADAAWTARLLRCIASERAWCPFGTCALVFEPGQGSLWLHLRGPAGTKEFVAGLLDCDPLPPKDHHHAASI